MLLATHTGQTLEAGLDEAGRGCLAGPVFAAAVILPVDFNPPFLNDSKQLSAKRREVLRPIICAEAVAWAVGQASEEEIAQLNIAQASYLAMHRAVAALAVAHRPDRRTAGRWKCRSTPVRRSRAAARRDRQAGRRFRR